MTWNGPNYRFVARWFRARWLPLWFGVLTLSRFGEMARNDGGPRLFIDGRVYLEAARDWIGGGDPWNSEVFGLYFAAPPLTLLPLAPFGFLPPDLALAILVGIVIASAVATVALLRLPWWWLLFPPLVDSVLSANVQALLVPLILLRVGWLAALLKVYAAVPLVFLFRWRQLLIVAAVTLATAPLLPWATYLDRAPEIAARFDALSNYALPPILYFITLPLGLAALLLLSRRQMAWLAVPAVWPTQQPYYTTLAMPTRNAMVLAIIAAPIEGSGLFATLALAATYLIRRRPGTVWARRALRRLGFRPRTQLA